MEVLKVLIVEDDLILAEQIADDLSEIGYIITDVVSNSEEALKSFKKRLPDIAVLDIQLKGSNLDGIELANTLNKLIRVPIIFLTALGGDETVRRARKAKPAYYLVKPYNQSQLKVSVGFALDNFVNNQPADVKHSLQFHSLPSNSFYPHDDSFFVKSDSKKYIKIEVSNLSYVVSEKSTIELMCSEERVIVYTTLNSFEEQISHPSLFRIHRSTIINMSKVVSFEQNKVFIKHNEELKEFLIGVTYKKAFNLRISKLLSR